MDVGSRLKSVNIVRNVKFEERRVDVRKMKIKSPSKGEVEMEFQKIFNFCFSLV